jgi:hypothetical protein
MNRDLVRVIYDVRDPPTIGLHPHDPGSLRADHLDHEARSELSCARHRAIGRAVPIGAKLQPVHHA